VEAGRVHLELVRLADVRPALTGDAAARVATLTGAAADALRALAAAIERERAPEGLQEPAERIETALAGLGGDGDLAAAYALARGETLGRELRSAARIAALPEQPHGAARAPLPTPTLAPSPERGKLEILRANLSPHSVNFQHALRLGVALVIGAALYKGLPLGRGYWVPFTVLMVLRPDFATTFTRGLARWAGTAAGVALSTALVAVVPLDARTLTALVVVVTFLSYTVFYVNYALYSVFLTAQVVFLTAFTGTSATTIALDRFVDTALGAALGLAIFLLLPTWERGRLPDTLAGMLAAERSYVAAVTGAYLAPQDYDSRAILQGRLAAWRAISNAQATAQRARLEPGSDRGASDRAQGILDAASRLARALLALDANLERRRDRAPLPVVGDFARAAETTLADLETALRAGQTPSAAGHERDLEVSAEALRRLDARTEASAEPDLAFFVSQADRIADSLATLRHVLATGDEAAS
ncbi:MAG TPA: FUSC family protein, partial [Thermomicrobiales bacterium]|nr:FUSC family protein [Thermomicrobiales bacterium]